MADQAVSPDHTSHLHGPISGPVHTGSGDIHYSVTLTSGKQTVFDASRLEARYRDSIRSSPELVMMPTPLGSVEIDKLYVMPRVAPVTWIYGQSPAEDGVHNPELALDVIRRFSRVVIFGSPGIGKSTFLKFALLKMLDGHSPDRFPIYLSLYQYAMDHNGRDLLTFAIDQYLRLFYQGEELEALELLLRDWQTHDKLVFLLDGLDEVPASFHESLMGKIRGLPRFVLTSRPRGRVNANQESGANYDILPFAPTEVARFVRNWEAYHQTQSHSEPFSSAEFFNYIRRESRIADLVRIPQLLTILCWLWGKGGAHRYGTKGELLAEATDGLIDKAISLSALPEDKHLPRSRDLRHGLSELALTMLHESRITISSDEFIEFFEQAQITEFGELLMLAQRSGLLVATSGREDEWRFIHLVFQEHLAAEALIRHPEFETLARQDVARPDFEECLRISSGLLCDRRLERYAPRLKLLFEAIMAPENTDIFRLNWRLAGLCMAEVDHPEQRLGDLVEQLETGLLECASDWWARDRFAEAMGEVRTNGMRRKLIDALRDEDQFVRWAAAVALNHMADPATLQSILLRIEEESWPIIQGELARALGRIGSRDALPLIRRLLSTSPPDISLWQGLGEALGRLEDVETLISVAETQDPVSGYYFAKKDIVLLEAYPYMSEAGLAQLHQAIDQTDFSIWGSPADAYTLDEPSLEELEDLAWSKDPNDRLRAALALGRRGGEGAIAILIEMVLDEDQEVVQAASRMLRTMLEDGYALVYGFFLVLLTILIGDEPQDNHARKFRAAILLHLWKSRMDRELIINQREKLLPLLGVLTASDQAPLLGKLLELPSAGNEFAVTTIWVLGLLGDSEHADQVAAFLEHEDDTVRWAACWAAGETGGSEAPSRLVGLLHPEESTNVLQAACLSVGKLGVRDAADSLIGLLDAVDEPSVLSAAIWSLGQVSASQSINHLLAMLNDDRSEIRAAAVEALSRIGGSQVVPILIDSLAEENIGVQIAAATALGTLKDPRAEPGLIGLLSSNNRSLRFAAIHSLIDIGGSGATPMLHEIIETDADETISQAAADAFGNLASTPEVLALVDRFGDVRDSVRLNAIVSALLVREDEESRDEILRPLNELGIDGRVSRDRALVELRYPSGRLTNRSPTFLGQFGEDATAQVASAIKRLTSEDVEARWEAAVALGDLKSPASVGDLILAMLHPESDAWAAHACAEAIETIQGEYELAEQMREQRARAIVWLLESGDLPDLIEWLGQRPLEEDSTLTKMTRWVLQDVRALEALMNAYEPDNAQVRLVLWEIGAELNLRFMASGDVILGSGQQLSGQAATAQLVG